MKDGFRPAGSRSHHKEDKTMNPQASTHRHPLGTTAHTGQTCPESGIWKVQGSPSTTAPIAKPQPHAPLSGAFGRMGARSVCLERLAMGGSMARV